uniref:Ribosomal protein S1 n=1 Tax=Apophlaea sinclairii TaxID=212746 RepID=A0A1C9CBT7_9FLOR|nr:ribosomal protein S1 [Apophlaea sinclairii]AOM65829.1 ribosomal protein S1 [Apophlaea sinclairii]
MMKTKLNFTHNLKFLQTNFIYVLYKYKYNLNIGDIVAGTIISKESKGYLVDIGDSRAAFLPYEETSITTNKFNTLNNTQEFFIISYDISLSYLILSIKRLEYLRAWKRIKQLQAEDIIIYTKVIDQNFGGLLVNFNGINGFLPNSHISNLIFKQAMLKTIIPLKFLVIDENNNQLVFSHRRAILSLSSFVVGSTINAKIISLKKYGILVKIHNIQALLHNSEIPRPVLHNFYVISNVNKFLKAVIIHINERKGRVSISVKKIFC